MSARHLPLLLAALAALAAGLWLVTRGGAAAERDRGALRPSTVPEVKAEERARDAELAELPVAPRAVEESTEELGAAAAARRVASSDYEGELARGWFVEGRVVVPAGIPLDERVKVVARGKAFKHGPLHSAAIAADGRFRVAFSERTKVGELELDARYLYLDAPMKVAQADTAPVVLEGRLGGVLAGRVLPLRGIADAAESLAGKPVQLFASRRASPAYGRVDRSVRLDRALAFEFTAVPPHTDYVLAWDPLIYEGDLVKDIHVEAGAETVIDLPVRIGVSVSGRVADGAGAPVAGAKVEALGKGGSSSSTWREAKTAPDGTFAVRGLSPGAIMLKVEAKGFTDLEEELGRLESGAERTGLELKLARGGSISGRVVWADGSPVADATVTATRMEKAKDFDARPGFKSDAQGRFTITGLEPGPHQVGAFAKQEETVMGTSRLLGREVERTVRTTLRASLLDVEPGAGEVVLELVPGLRLGGVVVDDLGRPVAGFTVSCEPERNARGGAGAQSATERAFLAKTETFRNADGRFTLTGLVPGAYRLEVRAEGHLASDAVKAAVPAEAALPPIRLTRAARISGVVLTPQGEAAPWAEIEVTGAEVGRRLRSSSSVVIDGEWLRDAGASDGAGRFEVGVDPLAEGVKVRARLDGFRSSELLALAPAPGAAVEGVTLRLRPGATLTGVLLDRDGKGLAGRTVEVGRVRGEGVSVLQTDAAGRFEVPGLEPGSYTADAFPSDDEVAALGVVDVERARDVLRISATVKVAEGGGHVVLAASLERPVRIFGTLTAGGRPTPAFLLIEQKGKQGSSIGARADTEGAYEALLPRPGAWAITLQLQEDGSWVSVPASIKGPAEERLDLDIPVGSLSGRVHGPGGPLKGAKVLLKLERGTDGAEGSAHASVKTDKDGRYGVQLLPVGTWSVSASDDDLARAKLEGLAVASGQHLGGVDLHLAPAPARGR